MRNALASASVVAALLGALSTPTRADIAVGTQAPGFTKNQLAGGPGAWSAGAPISLGDYAGKVVVLFLLGYG